MTRELTYADAILEAHVQLLEADARVFVIGQGLWSPWYVGSSMRDLDKRFGRGRILDSPVSENATTGAAVGAAMAGMRPIVVHPRMDFMLLAVDPIVNQGANWSYMFAGQVSVPVVIRAIINRGGEQAAQHSQAVQAMFAHVPGLKVVMPATPADAKGLLVAAVYDGNPVLYIDDRWLYERRGPVSPEMYRTPIGQAAIVRRGADLTLVASSHAAALAEQAVSGLAAEGLDVELIDLRTIKPWDRDTVFASVRKTGRLLVVDGAWRTGGIAAEILAEVASELFGALRAAPERLGLVDTPAPMSVPLEQAYYLQVADIADVVRRIVVPRAGGLAAGRP